MIYALKEYVVQSEVTVENIFLCIYLIYILCIYLLEVAKTKIKTFQSQFFKKSSCDFFMSQILIKLSSNVGSNTNRHPVRFCNVMFLHF